MRPLPVLVCLLVAALPAIAEDSLDALFDRGNAAYRDGKFVEAERAWTEMTARGVHDPRVEYDLGNAAWKQGKTGAAIWRWERALALDSSDEDARRNLALARSTTLDRVDADDGTGPVRALRRFQDRVGPDAQFAALLVLVWIGAGFASRRLARPGGFTPAAGWVAGTIGAIAAVVALSWWTTWERLHGTPRAIVLVPALDVLAGPSEGQATVFTVHEGTTLQAGARREGWVEVELPDGLRGWVPVDAVGLL